MNPKAYLTDDDKGVSPVIGVILMVAITVILAAVIATFVIGLGDSNKDTGPSTTVEFNYDKGKTQLEISVTGGENLDPANVEIQGKTGGGTSVSTTWKKADGKGYFVSEAGPKTELQAGSSITITATDKYDISVVYVNPDTEESFTLRSDKGPDA